MKNKNKKLKGYAAWRYHKITDLSNISTIERWKSIQARENDLRDEEARKNQLLKDLS